MSQQGMVIDSLEFARQHRVLSGRLELGQLPRLADGLFDAKGNLDFAVSGEMKAKAGGEEYSLALSIDGMLRLICQRCLGALEYPVRIRSCLILVQPDAPWPDETLEDDIGEAIEAGRELDLIPLLEEEILLSLPIAPRHATCTAPGNPAATGETSPFAKLAQLKRN
jgi:uncharacterized protein